MCNRFVPVLPKTYQTCSGLELAGYFADSALDILQEPNDKTGKPKPVLSTEYITYNNI